MKNLSEKNNRLSMWFVTGNLPPHFSGAGRNDLLLAPFCIECGLDITLVTNLQKGDREKELICGVPVRRIKLGNDHNVLSRFTGPLHLIRHLYSKPRPSIIRFRGFSFSVGLMIFLIKVFYRHIKIIVQPAMFGGDDAVSIRKKPFGSFLIRQIHRADSIFAMNELIKDSFIADGYPQGKIFTVNNSTDVDKFHPLPPEKKTALRNHLGLKENALIFITSGILSIRKRQTFITDAFLQMLLRNGDKNLLLIHMGPTSSDLRALGRFNAAEDAKNEENSINKILKSLGFNDKVILIGNQKKPEIYLQAADFFLHASCFEGEANVINEAMASGLPCIIPDTQLYKSQVPDNMFSYRYKKDSTVSLARILEEIVLNNENKFVNPDNVRSLIIKTRHPKKVAKQYCSFILKSQQN